MDLSLGMCGAVHLTGGLNLRSDFLRLVEAGEEQHVFVRSIIILI